MAGSPPDLPAKPITLNMLRGMVEAGDPIVSLTCYDATTARWLADAGVHVLLVGDSAANVVLGFDASIHAPLEFMITITAAVKRGAPNLFVMGDMPFMSYQADDAEAVRNAGRFMTEGNADAVKVEVDRRHGDLVGKLSRAGIPVVAHLGWKPQMVRQAGIRTARVAGRTAGEVRAMADEAELMADRGASMLLIEQCTAEAAERIVQAVRIPVIGCGGGRACHGHVVVLHDLLGMNPRVPSFVPKLAEAGATVRDAARRWAALLRSGDYLAEHPYSMDDGEAQKLKSPR